MFISVYSPHHGFLSKLSEFLDFIVRAFLVCLERDGGEGEKRERDRGKRIGEGDGQKLICIM